jgi:hypothetical protein
VITAAGSGGVTDGTLRIGGWDGGRAGAGGRDEGARLDDRGGDRLADRAGLGVTVDGEGGQAGAALLHRVRPR